MAQEHDTGPLTVAVRNVGGIDATELSFSPGVTVLTGENATNRTSLLTAISGALGGSRPNLKSDAEEGSVTLELDGSTYTRRYHRRNDTVVVDGDSYTDEDALVDLFVCLLEDNPTRRAVERGDDLRELVMRPIDTESIERRIRSKREERDRLRDRLAEIERRCARLPELAERREQLAESLSAVEDELEEHCVRENGEAPPAAEAAEERMQELEERQRELRRTRERIDTEESSLSALCREREELAAELEDVECRDEELESIEEEVERLRRRERELADSINDLTAINQFNRELLSGDATPVRIDAAGDVTDQLDPSSSVVACWTCGSRVERSAILERLDELGAVTAERREERSDVRDRIESLRQRRDELQAVEDRQDEIEARLSEVDDEIDRREGRLAELTSAAEALEAAVESVREGVANEGDLKEDLRKRYAELSDLEYERGRLEGELCEVDRDIETLQELQAEREQLEAQRSEIESELTCLRTHVEETEEAAVETFNEHVGAVLSLLGYENIARVWIERKVDGDLAGTAESQFELHVIRERDDGSVYEDTVANLSESEREVIGLVVGLAGYLVHDVGEQVPVMLLDSLEAIDGDRIAALVDYFADYVPYLLVALLPEDAAAIECEHRTVSATAI